MSRNRRVVLSFAVRVVAYAAVLVVLVAVTPSFIPSAQTPALFLSPLLFVVAVAYEVWRLQRNAEGESGTDSADV